MGKNIITCEAIEKRFRINNLLVGKLNRVVIFPIHLTDISSSNNYLQRSGMRLRKRQNCAAVATTTTPHNNKNKKQKHKHHTKPNSCTHTSTANVMFAHVYTVVLCHIHWIRLISYISYNPQCFSLNHHMASQASDITIQGSELTDSAEYSPLCGMLGWSRKDIEMSILISILNKGI